VLVVEKTYLVYGQQIKIKPYRNVGFFCFNIFSNLTFLKMMEFSYFQKATHKCI